VNRKLIIYLDNCCNSRLFDGDTSPKVKAQADAIRRIIRNRQRGKYFIVGSFVVETEIGQIPDGEKRLIAEQYYMASIDGAVGFSAHIIARATKLELMGLKMMDARHLAAAEAAGAAFLLTTDEKFLRKCQNRNITAVKVIDPIDFERR
jgi:predicted nucleic acid-binding protein